MHRSAPYFALAIALGPFVVFVFVHPGELPARFVGVAHVAASIWYVLVAVGLMVALATAVRPLPRGWPIYPVFVMIGAVPCVIVLYQWVRGRYPAPAESAGNSAEPGAANISGRNTGS